MFAVGDFSHAASFLGGDNSSNSESISGSSTSNNNHGCSAPATPINGLNSGQNITNSGNNSNNNNNNNNNHNNVISSTASTNNNSNSGCVASFVPSYSAAAQGSPLLESTPPTVARALAQAHSFVDAANYIASLLTWTSSDTWSSFLVVIAFAILVLYAKYVIALLPIFIGLYAFFTRVLIIKNLGFLLPSFISSFYSNIKFNSFSKSSNKNNFNSTGNSSLPGSSGGDENLHNSSKSNPPTLDSVVHTLATLSIRLQLLFEPFKTSSTIFKAISRSPQCLLRVILVSILITPIHLIICFYFLSPQSVFIIFGIFLLTFHSTFARVTRTMFWRSRTVRKLASAVTGLNFLSGNLKTYDPYLSTSSPLNPMPNTSNRKDNGKHRSSINSSPNSKQEKHKSQRTSTAMLAFMTNVLSVPSSDESNKLSALSHGKSSSGQKNTNNSENTLGSPIIPNGSAGNLSPEIINGRKRDDSSLADRLSSPLSGIDLKNNNSKSIPTSSAALLEHHRNSLENEPVRFTYVVYENQRKWLGLGWTSSLFTYERAPWTDEFLNEVKPIDEFTLPDYDSQHGYKWKWLDSDWRIDMSACNASSSSNQNGSNPTSPNLNSSSKTESSRRESTGFWGNSTQSNSNAVEAHRTSYSSEDDNNQGWIYYDNSWKNPSVKEGTFGKYTRRRRWIRTAELVPIEPSALFSSPSSFNGSESQGDKVKNNNINNDFYNNSDNDSDNNNDSNYDNVVEYETLKNKDKPKVKPNEKTAELKSTSPEAILNLSEASSLKALPTTSTSFLKAESPHLEMPVDNVSDTENINTTTSTEKSNKRNSISSINSKIKTKLSLSPKRKSKKKLHDSEDEKTESSDDDDSKITHREMESLIPTIPEQIASDTLTSSSSSVGLRRTKRRSHVE